MYINVYFASTPVHTCVANLFNFLYCVLFVFLLFLVTSVVCVSGSYILCCPFCFLYRFTPSPHVAHLFNSLCCCLFFCLLSSFCFLWLVLFVSLDCPFCVAPFVFSNVSPPCCSPFYSVCCVFYFIFVFVLFLVTSVVCVFGLSILCCPFCFL